MLNVVDLQHFATPRDEDVTFLVQTNTNSGALLLRCRGSDDGLLEPYDYTPYFYFLMVFKHFKLERSHTCPVKEQLNSINIPFIKRHFGKY